MNERFSYFGKPGRGSTLARQAVIRMVRGWSAAKLLLLFFSRLPGDTCMARGPYHRGPSGDKLRGARERLKMSPCNNGTLGSLGPTWPWRSR